ncbi:hypothetical protein L1887_57703 [Cichorium endivia]|nr:hypothetical protein L1887_57703 [Cichorium endivia]
MAATEAQPVRLMARKELSNASSPSSLVSASPALEAEEGISFERKLYMRFPARARRRGVSEVRAVHPALRLFGHSAGGQQGPHHARQAALARLGSRPAFEARTSSGCASSSHATLRRWPKTSARLRAAALKTPSRPDALSHPCRETSPCRLSSAPKKRRVPKRQQAVSRRFTNHCNLNRLLSCTSSPPRPSTFPFLPRALASLENSALRAASTGARDRFRPQSLCPLRRRSFSRYSLLLTLNVVV